MIVAPTCVTAPGHSNSCSRTCDLTLEELKVVLQQSAPASNMAWPTRRTKLEVVDAFLRALAEKGVETTAPGYVKSIRTHFDLLPTRYALDVDIHNPATVLGHQRLLTEARSDPSVVSFAVRPVEVIVAKHRESLHSESPGAEGLRRHTLNKQHTLPKPAFGSSPNLQALALDAGTSASSVGAEPAQQQQHHQDDVSAQHSTHSQEHLTFYEITVASADQPKLLSRLSEALSDLGLNIREAHAFNTSDGFSLDVFVVDQFQASDTPLEELLGQRLSRMPPPPAAGQRWQAPAQPGPAAQSAMLRLPEEALPLSEASTQDRPPSPVDDWEIDISQLEIDAKIASGAFSNLYRGYYCGQEVAVKILKDVHDDTSQYQEFLQEVSMMRKVRHKNIVQFIGACTRKPNLCIVFEFMSGGSVYDWVRREGSLRLSQVLKIAAEVARGMDYLHQRKIIHRDLKSANLLMDEHHVVKIADFGVARVIQTTGHMTAETGTYRWMAPEVIEHKPYDGKADVFSFGVVLWELLTCRVPYSEMTPLQAAVGVVQRALRPPVPPGTPPALAQLMQSCWEQDPALRPTFKELAPRLQQLLQAAQDEDARKAAVAALSAAKPSSGGGLLSKLRGKG